MPNPHPLVRSALVAIVASAFLLPGLASHAQSAPAATSTTPAAPPAPSRDGGWGHHMHDRMARELDRLKTSLRLDARQSTLWDQAAQQMKPPADGRERMRAQRDQLTGMLADPNFDPRKLAATMDQEQARRMGEMKARRDAWISVYDALNPVQRGQVREFLRERLASRGHEHGWMHGPMHGPMGGEHGQRPDADPTAAPKG